MRFVLLLLTLALCAPTQAQDWQLVWADEFDYEGLPDSTKWAYDVGGWGWGNNELQHYTEADLDNARVQDGVLTIEARHEPTEGKDYSSARLLTRGKAAWTYGRIEVRAQLPHGLGTWAAIWMLFEDRVHSEQGWPDNGEIDIMEHVGFDPGVVHATVHTKAFNHMHGTHVGDKIDVPAFDEAFHEYAIEWTPTEIRAYVDDEHYFTYANTSAAFTEETGQPAWASWPFDHPHHLILNIAVGGNWGGQQGVDPAVFPQQMRIDYVRVYEDPALGDS
ncbi:MAG: glycoside hydrolase family 16 protein [Bacteroidota bacterium]